jgi:hypothetical protein
LNARICGRGGWAVPAMGEWGGAASGERIPNRLRPGHWTARSSGDSTLSIQRSMLPSARRRSSSMRIRWGSSAGAEEAGGDGGLTADGSRGYLIHCHRNSGLLVCKLPEKFRFLTGQWRVVQYKAITISRGNMVKVILIILVQWVYVASVKYLCLRLKADFFEWDASSRRNRSRV